MYIKNFFRLAEWNIEDLLKAVVSLLTIYFFCLFVETAGLDLHIIQNLVSVIIILFIPGTLFLRIIKFDVLKNNLELILYSLGLSLVIIMSLGFTINTLLPVLGIEQPVNQGIFVSALSFIIILMSYVVYLTDQDTYITPLIDTKSLISNSSIFLILLPFLSIIGAYFMNNYQINLFFIVLIFLIGIVALMVGFQKFLSPKMYPLAILCISLALLFHKSLISNYIWGWDISLEYYMAQNVIQNGFWFMNYPNNYNSMLSVVMLGPYLYFFTGLNMVWVFKILYPFIFSFLPVGLYFIFKKQTNPPIAFLSVFFFISLFTFYTEMLAVLRQIIAEVFLVMIILLMVSNNLNPAKRSLLAILFLISLIFSHYSLAYILLFLMLCSMFIIFSENHLKYIRFVFIELIPGKLVILLKFDKSNIKKERLNYVKTKFKGFNQKISVLSNHVLSNYLKTGDTHNSSTNILKSQKGEINKFLRKISILKNFKRIINSKSHKSLINRVNKFLRKISILKNFKRIINSKSHKSLINRINKHKIDNSHHLFNRTILMLFLTFLFTWYLYTSSSSAMVSILNVGNDIVKNIINLMDPNSSQGLSMVLTQQKSFFRDIHKYLYLTSQFFVFLGLVALILNQTHLKFQKEFKSLALAAFILLVAGIVVPFLASQMNTSRLLHIALIFLAPFLVVGIIFGLKILRKRIRFLKPSFSLKFVSIYLVIFLVMDCGLAYQFVPQEEGISIAFSTTYDFPKLNERELQSAKWLKNEFGEKGIYADKHRSCILRSIYPDCGEVPPYSDLVKSDYYLYLGTINIQKNGLYIYKMSGANVIQEIGYSNPSQLIKDRGKIYDNGGSVIYGSAK